MNKQENLMVLPCKRFDKLPFLEDILFRRCCTSRFPRYHKFIKEDGYHHFINKEENLDIYYNDKYSGEKLVAIQKAKTFTKTEISELMHKGVICIIEENKEHISTVYIKADDILPNEWFKTLYLI